MARIPDWLGHEDLVVTPSGTHAFKEVLPTSAINKGDTLVRVRGSVLAHDGTAGADDRVTAAGLVFVDDSAVIAGMPDPNADPDADWLWHSWFTLYAESDAGLKVWDRVLVDNKSMRKVASGVQRLVFIGGAPAGRTMHYSFGFRILRLLP